MYVSIRAQYQLDESFLKILSHGALINRYFVKPALDAAVNFNSLQQVVFHKIPIDNCCRGVGPHLR